MDDVDLNVNGQTQPLASTITYAPFGGIETLTYGNNHVLTQQRDTTYRLTDQSIPGILSLDYPNYDFNGNLKRRDNSTTTPVDISNYSYDALNRLDTAEGPFSTPNTWDYSYDLNGNRTTTKDWRLAMTDSRIRLKH